ncbi:hypothetical protein CHS0354_041126 [Potamilus streckersoni]|uniref:Uncharacterized protein n=1 Tax=Potamilus streckersoni TaxID=2493646 RepID=A0AAE0VTI8_9BIVA|nr:hypothetical protein CHS0354_041126 [Potamilus streckersoni]
MATCISLSNIKSRCKAVFLMSGQIPGQNEPLDTFYCLSLILQDFIDLSQTCCVNSFEIIRRFTPEELAGVLDAKSDWNIVKITTGSPEIGQSKTVKCQAGIIRLNIGSRHKTFYTNNAIVIASNQILYEDFSR